MNIIYKDEETEIKCNKCIHSDIVFGTPRVKHPCLNCVGYPFNYPCFEPKENQENNE